MIKKERKQAIVDYLYPKIEIYPGDIMNVLERAGYFKLLEGIIVFRDFTKGELREYAEITLKKAGVPIE